MAEEEKQDERRDPHDGEYIGNIWGWKFSRWGLGIILFFVALMVYRHVSLGVPFGDPDPFETNQEQHDSLDQSQQLPLDSI